MQSKENELGTRSVGRLLFSLALPAITAQVVNVLYNMVDRMYIGHIPVVGATALTGLGVTLPVILLVSAFATLASMGGAPRASIMMGKGRKEDAERILGNCTMALVVMAVLLTAVILIFGREALLIFGADQETIGYAMGLSGDLRAGYHRRAGGAGPERLHHPRRDSPAPACSRSSSARYSTSF